MAIPLKEYEKLIDNFITNPAIKQKLKALISKAYPKLTDDDYYKIRYEIATSPKALSDTFYSDTEKEAKVLDICNKHPQYKRKRFKIALA
ncbi:MAG: hypothetical protein IJP61_08220 [Treponema sp.]|nr:hypothetical protein [Treponema sp.]